MLSEALRLIRVYHDLKQSELADRLGLSKSYVSEIERGHKTPTLDVIEKYASEFRIPASSILFFSEKLSSGTPTENLQSRAKGIISGKVLSFLKFIEERTSNEENSEKVS